MHGPEALFAVRNVQLITDLFSGMACSKTDVVGRMPIGRANDNVTGLRKRLNQAINRVNDRIAPGYGKRPPGKKSF